MSNKPAEISQIIKEQIRHYRSRIEMTETGTVILVGDGIARVYGLRSCMAGELLEFEDGSVGLAQNLEEETVSVAVLSDQNDIHEGSAVKRTGRKVMICHVLRYSDFYVAIKERILNGEIGKIVSIKDETCVIETTHERTKIRILKSAVSRVDVKAEDSEG